MSMRELTAFTLHQNTLCQILYTSCFHPAIVLELICNLIQGKVQPTDWFNSRNDLNCEWHTTFLLASDYITDLGSR